MKIAMFAEAYTPTINGVVQSIIQLKDYFESHGHEVAVFTPGKSNPKEKIFGCPRITIKVGYGVAIPKFSKEAKEWLRDADILHTHQPFILARYAAKFAKRYKKPLIFTNHCQYELYLHYAPFKRITGPRVLKSIRKFMARCDKIILPCASFQDVLNSKYGVPKSKLALIHNSISFPKKAVKFRPASDKEIILTYIGRLGKEKSIHQLLRIFNEAYKKDNRLRLNIFGIGPEMKRLKKNIREEGLTNVINMPGLVSHDKIFEELEKSDIFVSASVSEIHPLTLLEAMHSYNVPIVFDSPGFTDTLMEKFPELVMPKDNDKKFASKILELAKNKSKLDNLKKKIQKLSLEYDVKKVGSKTGDLYKSLIKKNKN
jgi:1,2-diacylglycerol 3-alpha-glucosyltransferase